MSNGTGLFGHPSSTQSGVIVPRPGNPNFYYVFTVDYISGSNGLRYSTVDMSLAAGLGAVVQKNTLLFTTPCEKITAVRHCNNTDVWVITRAYGSGQYRAWLVTAAGVAAAPVISTVNNILSPTTAGPFVKIGYLKAAPDGAHLAAQTYGDGHFELSNFDNSTGIVSGMKRMLTMHPSLPFTVSQHSVSNYGVEFSPNGKYVYVNALYANPTVQGSSANPAFLIYQLDISSNDSTLIEQSRYRLDSFLSNIALMHTPGALQLAKNGKIYDTHMLKDSLHVINSPNVGGAGCGWVRFGQPLAVGTSGQNGLPTFIQTYFSSGPSTLNFSYTGNCSSTNVSFTFSNPSGVDSVRWNFGDPVSGPANTSNVISPAHNFSSTGFFTVKAYAFRKSTQCSSGIDTITNTIYVGTVAAALGADTILCRNDTLTIGSPSPGASYLWNTGAVTPQISVFTGGSYAVTKTLGNCIARDTINVSIAPPLNARLGNDTILCAGIPLVLSPAGPVPPGATYLWSNGTTGQFLTVDTSGIYHIELRLGSCRERDTIAVLVDSPGHLAFVLDDSVFCEGNRLTLTARDTGDGLQSLGWNLGDGSTAGYVNPINRAYDTSGNYIITLIATYRACPADTFSKAITVLPFPTLNLGPDTFLCVDGAPILLQNLSQVQGPVRYRWSTGDTTPSIVARNYGAYWGMAGQAGCETYDTVQVFKDCYIDIPNAFTPDGDGLNDYFIPRVLLSRSLSSFKMSIFNRWGQAIFETTSKDGRGWDGRFNEIMQPQGVFVYLIDAVFVNGRKETYQGNVTLLR